MGDAAQNAKETTSPGDPSPGPQPNESRQESGGNALQRQVQPATQEPNRVGSGTTAGRKTTASTGYSPPRKKTASSPVDGDVRMASRSSNAYQQRSNATNAGEEGRDYVADFLAATAQSNPRGALGVATHPFPQGTYSDVHGFNQQQVCCNVVQHNSGENQTRTLMHTEMTRLAYAMRNVRRLDYAMHSSKPTKRARAMRGSLRTKRKQKLCDMTIRYCACMWICICNFANAFICNFVALIANGPLLSRALVSLHTCYTIAHGTRQKMWTYGATPRCGRRARTHRTSTACAYATWFR